MSLIDFNMCRDLVESLNKELVYKLSEREPCLYSDEAADYLQLSSNGDKIQIHFLGSVLFCSKMEKELENIPIETEMILNEREKFEIHIRILMNDKIKFFKDIEM